MSARTTDGLLFDRIRDACAEVSRRARAVTIDEAGVDALAHELARDRAPVPEIDPGQQRLADAKSTVAFVITLNAINFGSGYFPHLRKAPGRSGYLTISGALRDHFERHGPWSAASLTKLSAADCARIFGQRREPPVDELMELFSQALRDLGRFLIERHAGRFAGPVEEAEGSAARLVCALADMRLYRDVALYEELEVPFYKRAQITCADLALTLGGEPLGRFHDLDQLTLFADNLVPHVLRMLGVLVYDERLALRIDREDLIPSGSREEIEIRAVALHAVEQLRERCRKFGFSAPSHALDRILWTRGQHPDIKARPRHRTRCTYY